MTADLLGVRRAFDATTSPCRQHHPQAGRRETPGVDHRVLVLPRSFQSGLRPDRVARSGMHAVADSVQNEDSARCRRSAWSGRWSQALPHLIRIATSSPSSELPRSRAGCGTGTSTTPSRTPPAPTRSASPPAQPRHAARPQPWHLYPPVGLLMGLGFDTATQARCSSLPPARLRSPCLVRDPGSAGSLRSADEPVDTADGIVMARTYRWAFITPGRKVFYNLTITVLSVVVALVVGGIADRAADRAAADH